jgi:hypothetical protein
MNIGQTGGCTEQDIRGKLAYNVGIMASLADFL